MSITNENDCYVKVCYCMKKPQILGWFIGRVIEESCEQLKDFTVKKTMISVEDAQLENDDTLARVMFKWHVSAQKDG